ncbi:DUF4347 domain-containing protein [Massilia sp. TSP1-1-2]|uniref:DUF4347 domain-containing protein n=1 Tax=Massilia sp. TSP1-1-2 TaxID=2804649 RepID=UPI003CEB06B2
MTSKAPTSSTLPAQAAARRTLTRRKPSPLALEARLMFDGAAMATLIDAPEHAAPLREASTELAATLELPTLPTLAAPPQRHEIAFIDTTIAGWQTLAAGLRTGIELVLLDPARDAFAQMAERLQGSTGLDAIHLVSHGSVGALVIGGQTYQQADLAGHASELATIGHALGEQGDLLLYGCDIGQGSSGAALVDAIARATGADVAASTDTTGSAANFGGNWQLERASGAIDGALLAPAALLSGFEGKLAKINLSGNSGWTAIMYGTGRDPDGDSQAGAADTDIVGDATHGSLYAAYDDNGTVSTADDTLVFRLRIDNPTSSTYFGGVAIVGMDANLDGRADIFMAVDGRNNGQAVKLYEPGTGANMSPNTTSTSPLPAGWLANGGVYAFSASNYAVTAVSAASDPHYGAATLDPVNGTPGDIAGDGKTDVFVSWRMPLADLAAVLAKPSPVDRSGIYGPRGATGITGFTKDTVVQYISFTQTQTGPINGDLNGVGASYDKNATFAELGAFTAPMSASAPVSAGPGITIGEPISGGFINDAEDNSVALSGTTAALANGVKVTITATDGSSTLTFIDAATVSANAWTTAGLDLSALGNGALSFTATAGGAVDSATAVHDKAAPLVGIAQLASAVTGKPTFSGTSDLADGALLTLTLDTDNVAATANLVYQVMVSSGAWSLNTATVAPLSGSMPSGGLPAFTKVSATATDSAGNSSTAVALNRPTVTAVSTNDTTPTVSGTWTNVPGDSLSVTVNGVACTPTISGNSWSVQVSTALASGASYEVVATVARAGLPAVSDTTTLEASITSSPLVAIDITGDSAGDPTSNGSASGSATLPVISGTSSNAGGFVIVRLDPNNDGNLSDAVTYSVTPNGAGVWTLDTASAAAIAGSRPNGGFVGALGILASDSSGSVSDSQVLTITTPTLAIGTITSTASPSGLAGINNSGAGATFLNLVEDNSVIFTGSATGGSSVTLTITDASGNFVTVANVAVAGGAWSSSAAPVDLSALDNGTLTVRAALNGTTVSATNSTVTHDKVAPQIFNTTSSEIKKSSPAISGSSDLLNTVLAVSFTPAGGTLQTVDVTTDASGRWTTGALLNAPSGNPTSAAVSVVPKVAATAIDGAGNIAQPLNWTQTLSANASTKTITVGAFNAGTDIINSEVTGGVIISGTTTLASSPVVSVRVTDINGNFADISTTASAAGAWSATLSNAAIKGLVNGPLTVKASAVESGTLTIYDIAVPATLSLTSPTVSVTDNVAGTATGAVLFTFAFTENVSGFDVTDVDVTNGTKGSFTVVNAATYTLAVTPTAGSAGTMLVSVAGAKAVSTNTGRANVAGSDSQGFETTGAAAAPTVTVVTTALANDSTPLLTGTSSLAPGAPVLINIDTNNDGVTDLSYSATVQADHSWSLDTGSATPSTGSLPGAGLSAYARITATATNAYGNSTTATGLNLPTVNPLATNDNTPSITGSWTQIGGDSIAVVVNGVTYSLANGNLTASATGWSITTGALADGAYSVTATTTRGGGGTAIDPTTLELTIDTTAGVGITTHGGAAAAMTNSPSPVIGGTVSGIADGTVLTLGLDTDNNGSYELSYLTLVSGGAWSVDTGSATPASGSFPAGGLNGSTPLRISGSDAAGNAAADLQTLTVDVTPPAIAFTTNGKTADTTPLITGTSDLAPGSTITIDVDPDHDGDWSNQQTYTTTVNASGQWSVQAGVQLTGTTLGLRASGTDLAGNSTSVLKPLEIVANAPSIAITSPIASVGADGIANATEDDSIVIVGTTGNVGAGSTVSVTITDGSITITDTVTVQAGGTWSLAPLNLSGMANGSISVSAVVTDIAGDAYTDSTSFTHDKSALIAIDSISVDTGMLADFVTTDNTVSISGSATANAQVQVLVKDGVGATVAAFNLAANGGGAWTTAATAALASGNYTLEATVAGTTVTRAMTIVDASAPVLVGSSPADNATGVTANASLTLTFSRNVQAGAGYISLYLADGTLLESFNVATGAGDQGGSVSFNGATGLSVDPFSDLASGASYYIKIAASAVIDSAGNAYAGIANATTLNFTAAGADSTAPTITGPSGAAGDATAVQTINENSAVVTTVSASESVTWSLSGGADAAKFTINAGTGALSFVSAPDFETPTDVGANNTYVVQVQAIDGSGNAATQTITVTVANLDEAAPIITGPSGAAGDATAIKTINENSAAVTTVTASESVTWSLSGGADAAKFTINAGTGALSFVSAPDFETPTDVGANNTYVVQVQAIDASGNAATQTITVTVANLDEAAPVITGPFGAAGDATAIKTINENSAAVTTVTASESVTWSLSGGADAAKFAINAGTGALSFISAPDFETPTDVAANNTYVVQVQAMDASGNAATQTITVTVADLDETAPGITGPSGAAGDATAVKTINENSAAVTTVTASESVTWSLSGGADAAKFTINVSTGALSFISAPDFETPTDVGANNTYVVKVQAMDGSGNAATQTITITVADLDEAAPVITGPSGAAGDATTIKTINENSAAVTTVTASESVTWSLSGGADVAKFTINAGTGALSFVSAPDFETPTDFGANNTYVVQVQAIDGSGNAATQTITITVADLDEAAPVITGPSGAAGDATTIKTINENSVAVTTVTASESVTWSLSGGADVAKFTINAGTGALSFVSAPDFETPTDVAANNTYVVQVQAMDASGNAATQTITVTVADLDEAAPVITGPSGAAGDATAIKTINENSATVANVTAGESVTWSLSGGADVAKFTINAGTGALSFVSAPDFETPTDVAANNTYVVQVQAMDASGNAATQTITVTVADLDEAAPVITGPSGPAGDATAIKTINENSAAVTTVTASESVTWSLSGGADAAKFTIDVSTGALSFVSAPDFETPTDSDANNTYVVQMQAIDASGNVATQTITVTVADIDEAAPLITGPGAVAGAVTSAMTISENATSVATLTASETVTWSVVSGADGALFAIDAASGALRFIGAPDFETPADADANNSYQVQVRAIDASGNAAFQTVTVTVADVDESIPDTRAPLITAPGGSAGAVASAKTINENTSAVMRLTASESVTWSLAGGADAAKFAIDAATGALRFLAAPDFEAPTDTGADNGYVVQVRAVDASGNAAEQSVTVTVADISDTAPAAPSLDMLASSDSGRSDTDNVTRATAPVIRVTLAGSAGEKVTLYSGSVVIASVTLSEQDAGAGFVDVTIGTLGEGVSNLTATRTNGAGNVSASSATLAVTLDTTAPAAPLVNPETVFTRTPVISGSAAPDGGERLSVIVNGVTYLEGDGQLERAGTSWTLAIPAADALALGTYSVSAVLTDAAGNSRADIATAELTVAQPAAVPQVPTPATVTQPEPEPEPVAAAPLPEPDAPAVDTALPIDTPLPGVRSIGDDISNPLQSAPELVVGAAPVALAGASGDVIGILTVRGKDAFQVVVMPSNEPALVLYRGVPDQDFDQLKDAHISFQVPADAFMHTDVNASVKLVATLSTGEPLPSWLRFDATTGRFEGTVPAGLGGELVISIKAIDMDGRHAQTIFRIKLVGNKMVGRQGLAEQLRQAAKRPAGLIPLPRKAA